MSQYICTVCGYVHNEARSGLWADLPADWRCPVCKAGKDAFHLQGIQAAPAAEQLEKPAVERELSPMEMSVICSSLARGCEKQYLQEESEAFRKLADFFRGETAPAEKADPLQLLELLENDLNSAYPYAHAMAGKQPDRGALRSLVWSEKVSNMLCSLLTRYEAEGEAMLEGTGVWICTVCGFISVSDTPPELCPVCKVPAWKFENVERRAN